MRYNCHIIFSESSVNLRGNFMISFENDYLEGAHEKVLQRLIETNMMQEAGYGADQFSQQAADKIREIIDCPHATVRFLVGGTQTNQVVISTVLEPYEAVISANTGHVAVHEGGAIEFSGHKVIELESNDIWKHLIVISKKNIWPFREWFIYHILQNMVRSIQKVSYKLCQKYVVSIKYHYLWMVLDWVMA